MSVRFVLFCCALKIPLFRAISCDCEVGTYYISMDRDIYECVEETVVKKIESWNDCLAIEGCAKASTRISNVCIRKLERHTNVLDDDSCSCASGTCLGLSKEFEDVFHCSDNFLTSIHRQFCKSFRVVDISCLKQLQRIRKNSSRIDFIDLGSGKGRSYGMVRRRFGLENGKIYNSSPLTLYKYIHTHNSSFRPGNRN